MFRNCFSVIWIATVIVASAWSQETVGGMVIYGQVSAGDSPLTDWRVQLAHIGDGETRSAELFWNGAFEFHQVPICEHRLRVIDATGHVAHDEVVSLRRDGESLSIRLRADDAAPGGRGETISVQQLGHKSPRKAVNELKNGRTALEKRQFTRAVSHLESAVAVDPESADVHNELGVAYYELAQYEQSLRELQKAIGLAPTHERANNNFCLVLLKTGRLTGSGRRAQTQ